MELFALHYIKDRSLVALLQQHSTWKLTGHYHVCQT